MKLLTMAVFLLCLVLAACGQSIETQPPDGDDDASMSEPASESMDTDKEDSVVVDEYGTTYTKDFGSYKVPLGWSEDKRYTEVYGYPFIVQEGDTYMSQIITVRVKENQFAASKHDQYRRVIVAEILEQQKDAKVSINAYGSYTEQKIPVYTFQIILEGSDWNTIQYYIIGDRQAFVVEQKTKRESVETDNAVGVIVNSFRWAEK